MKGRTQVHIITASCENMIDGKGMRPGDILQAANGKTVEVWSLPLQIQHRFGCRIRQSGRSSASCLKSSVRPYEAGLCKKDVNMGEAATLLHRGYQSPLTAPRELHACGSTPKYFASAGKQH